MTPIANSTKFPKLRTYKLFQKDFRLENYLIRIENTKHALALTRFRISSYNLRMETGRYDQRKIKPEERLCIYCRSQAVEDEQHYLTCLIFWLVPPTKQKDKCFVVRTGAVSTSSATIQWSTPLSKLLSSITPF